MNKRRDKHTKAEDIEKIAEQAEQGKDVSRHFSGRHVAKQRVNVDFPLNLLLMIDEECRRVGVTRQAWIKMACDERIRQIQIRQSDSLAV